MSSPNISMETSYPQIIKKLEDINPFKYSKDRNFIDGSVSRLSPYISRGMISTKIVFNFLMDKGYEFSKIEKFLQELCWRDYWQLIWIQKNNQINSDLRHQQVNVENRSLSSAIFNAETGIDAIDKSIKNLYESGYMHNHSRMYVASLACNIARSHWNVPAKWLYYNLLDADWGSNALSWQWVCGTNSNKKYFANQENINKYCHSNQKHTYLDVDYSVFEKLEVPNKLLETINPKLTTILPKNKRLKLNSKLPTLLYNFYNLDPLWRKEERLNRVLLLEPEIFKDYPISKKSVQFMLNLSENINKLQIFVGSFEKLKKEYDLNDFIYKEHPLNYNYHGKIDQRDWMFDHKENLNSFFSYWKKCKKKYLKSFYNN